ncbi:hypothetical protein EVAR_17254_1 [Eumeta japonica]|uniref:Uncharacterized protein n=1 Tax=Eumeta variegata TaxID=151549 RepID=A0A4C1TT01_EUMVA|nr:hypothetical protein EVAR_17254_1 [Eumeta japonica]
MDARGLTAAARLTLRGTPHTHISTEPDTTDAARRNTDTQYHTKLNGWPRGMDRRRPIAMEEQPELNKEATRNADQLSRGKVSFRELHVAYGRKILADRAAWRAKLTTQPTSSDSVLIEL